MPFYKVDSKAKYDAETDSAVLVPNIPDGTEYRIFRTHRDDDGCFVIETKNILIRFVEELPFTDPVISTHFEWWKIRPEDRAAWKVA